MCIKVLLKHCQILLKLQKNDNDIKNDMCPHMGTHWYKYSEMPGFGDD